MSLKLDGVQKNWQGFALKNINLTVEEGDYFTILGPTGAGKTLLLEAIMGFHTPSKGKIILNGVDITELPPEKRNIGYVPQNSMLFPHLTVRQNIAFGLKMRGIEKAQQNKIVDETLDLTKLRYIEHRHPASLSGGEKQKVALARILAINPTLILLDEPLASMDSQSAREFRNELKRIHAEDKKTVVHVTHNLIEALGLSSKAVIMSSGAIVQYGTVKELMAKPRNEFAARFLGYENVYRAEAIKRQDGFTLLDVKGLQFKAKGSMEGDVSVAIRPEDITITLTPTGNAEANRFEATITECIDMGPLVMVTADIGAPIKTAITKSLFLEQALENGKRVWLHFNENSVKILE